MTKVSVTYCPTVAGSYNQLTGRSSQLAREYVKEGSLGRYKSSSSIINESESCDVVVFFYKSVVLGIFSPSGAGLFRGTGAPGLNSTLRFLPKNLGVF